MYKLSGVKPVGVQTKWLCMFAQRPVGVNTSWYKNFVLVLVLVVVVVQAFWCCRSLLV